MSAAEFVWLAYLVAVNGLCRVMLVRTLERWYGSEAFDRVHDIATRASPLIANRAAKAKREAK